jgi:hypothetical protein
MEAGQGSLAENGRAGTRLAGDGAAMGEERGREAGARRSGRGGRGWWARTGWRNEEMRERESNMWAQQLVVEMEYEI